MTFLTAAETRVAQLTSKVLLHWRGEILKCCLSGLRLSTARLDSTSVSLCVVAVKVVLVPEGHVMTVAFAIELSIHELKRHLASELRVPADVLQISLDGSFLSPDPA